MAMMHATPSPPSLQQQVVTLFQEGASQIPRLRAAYVSPDGESLVVFGHDKTPAAYNAVASVVVDIQQKLDRYSLDAWYSAGFEEPEPGWVVAYVAR